MRCLLYYPTRAWQYRVLPFGLSLSPRVFMKVIEGTLARYGKWASGSSTISTIGSFWPGPKNNGAITGTWCSGTSASWGFGSAGKRASSNLCRESLFSVWSLVSVSITACLTDEHAQSVLNYLSSFRGRTVVPLKQFRGSWGKWHLQLQSRCFI